jgi:hypothetical protein
MECSLRGVTDTQILRVAQRILGDVPMQIVRMPPQVFLIATVNNNDQKWLVRFSTISPDHLAFDRL